MIYLASWSVSPLLVVLEIIVSGLTLAYFIKVFSCVFMGPARPVVKGHEKIKQTPKLMLAPVMLLAALCILFGFFPQLAMDLIEPATASLLNLSGYISVVLGG
jgi:multicomponent Na+:H+ antiporter subunit D